jgi:hypothetical protein
MKRFLLLALALLAVAIPASAQVVTKPTAASFTQSDAEFAASLGYHLDFYQCASVTAGACVGQATAPFQQGVDVPKALVTTIVPVAPDTNNRSFSFLVAPANQILSAAPAGIGFVVTLIVNGDPTLGFGESARSAASNPFFQSGAPPLAVTGLRLIP